jgi:hypothetical protein
MRSGCFGVYAAGDYVNQRLLGMREGRFLDRRSIDVALPSENLARPQTSHCGSRA